MESYNKHCVCVVSLIQHSDLWFIQVVSSITGLFFLLLNSRPSYFNNPDWKKKKSHETRGNENLTLNLNLLNFSEPLTSQSVTDI